MARPKLTFEQRRECEKLLDVIVESDERLTDFIAEYILLKAERDRLERDMADLSTARVDQFRREVEQLKAERDAALRDVEILIRRANDIP